MDATFNARALGLVWSPEATIDAARQAGFHAVDLLVRDLVHARAHLDDLRRRLDDASLAGGAFPLPINWRDGDAQYASDLAALPPMAAAAATLGLFRTATWVRPHHPHLPPETLLDWHVARLGPIVQILADHGIRLGLEVLGTRPEPPEERNVYLRRLGDAQPLIDALQPFGDVGLALDSFHAHAAGEDLPALVESRGPRSIVAVHIADAPPASDVPPGSLTDRDRRWPGQTHGIDLRRDLQALLAVGYDGPVMIETFSIPGAWNGLTPVAIAGRVASALRSVWPTGAQPMKTIA